ncbi:hypothetical protein [Catenovulum adriaticum]|uniref:HBM (Helical Bimodular) domain-containing sensor protein n=1 Tax=Catenovulum adriaticum TaxID=2984846 RepID=A0ABY7AIS3_9ALTE|nr:hypothetical protein [Catenovulum sp. TS8]WAJ68991.1 hypothetical protein OLW01_07250 [Catenovulum sp. TS8]
MKQTSLPLESTPDTSLSSKADSKKIKAGSSVQVNSTDRQDVNLPKKKKHHLGLLLTLVLSSLVLLLAASQWLTETKQQSSLLNYNQHSQVLAQLLVTQETLMSHPTLVDQQPDLILNGLQKTAKQLALMSQYPIFKSNFSAFEQNLNNALNQQNKIAANLTAHQQTQLAFAEQIKTIDDAKFNLAQALKPTIERLQTYKVQAEFEKLTANANRSELFNALNQQQGEEKFEALQASAESYIQSIEASFYVHQSADLQRFIEQSQASEKAFQQALRDFSDMPTRVALKNWYQTINDNQNLTYPEIKRFNLNRLELEQQLNQQINSWKNTFKKSQHLLIQINQHRLKNENNSVNPAILLVIIGLSLIQIIVLLSRFVNTRHI